MGSIYEIPTYQYLGNSLDEINRNLNLLSIRHCNLRYSGEKIENLYNAFDSIRWSLQSAFTTVSTLSSNWQNSSDIVQNLQGYWNYPIQLIYPSSINVIPEQKEIKEWLSGILDVSDYPDGQMVRVDFIMTPYDVNALLNTKYNFTDSATLDSLSTFYNTSRKNVVGFLQYNNQLNSLLSAINTLLKRNSQKVIETNEDVLSIKNNLSWVDATNTFVSSDYPTLSQEELKTLWAYLDLFYVIYLKYIPLNTEVGGISASDLQKFDSKNFNNNIIHNFYFKKINSAWDFYPSKNINFCAPNVCGDCVEYLDPNSQYTNTDCKKRLLYQLVECEGTLVGEPAAYELAAFKRSCSFNPEFGSLQTIYLYGIDDGSGKKWYFNANSPYIFTTTTDADFQLFTGRTFDDLNNYYDFVSGVLQDGDTFQDIENLNRDCRDL